MEDLNIIDDIILLHRNKQWLELVSKYHDHPDRSKLLWVFPSEDNLMFLKHTMEKLDSVGILSVGCGSGLLEWIIKEATGIPVKGIEVDGAWWKCKYAPPTFLPLIISNLDLENDEETKRILKAHSKGAILFCYFNNGPAFLEYMKLFDGTVLIIIGARDGKGTHTNPRPFGDITSPWILYDYQEVRKSGDYIAVYNRKQN